MTEWQELEALARQPASDRPDRPDITASDVGDYTFCGRSWWLRRQQAGLQSHARAGLQSTGDTLMRIVWICVAYAAAIAGVCVWLIAHVAR